MNALTQTQRDTLNALGFEAYAIYFSGIPFVASVGLNGAALKSLIKLGLVEQNTHKCYSRFYRLTEAGKAA